MCPFTSVMSAFVVETAFLKGLMQVTVILVNICINFYWSKHHQKKVGIYLLLSFRTWETLQGKQYILSCSLARCLHTR